MSYHGLNPLLARLDHYRSRNYVHQHVIALLSSCRSLVPKVDNYVFNDGRTVPLLGLEGTVPIFYRNKSYNIPVMIWISETYPSNPPMCYVKPTRDMRIKPSHKHVDSQGFVYMPYLSQWNARSTLVELVQQLSALFGQEPPVFKAKQASPPIPAYNSHQSGNIIQSASTFAQSQSVAETQHPYPQQPYLPGYPAQQGYYGAQTSQPQSYYQAQQQPVQHQQQPMQHQQQPMQHQQQPMQHQQQLMQHQQQPMFHSQPQIHQPLDEKTRLRNQLTQRVRATLEEFMNDIGKEINSLFERQFELKTGSAIIENGLETMRKEKDDISERLVLINEKNTELEKWLASNEDDSVPVQINEIVKPKDTWSEQMFGVVSHDFAVEDALYVLDRALADDRIELPEFLKNVRSLARDQYFARALSMKIEEKQTEALASR